MKREELIAKLEARKAELAKQKRIAALQERRAQLVKKPSTQVLQERKSFQNKQTVLKEANFTSKAKGAQTITEALKTKLAGVPEGQREMYEVLSENIVRAAKGYLEATQASNYQVGGADNGAGVGLIKTYFDIFFGYFPTLITPIIASVQPIPTERADVFFYETVAGSDKGAVTKGSKMITPFEVNTDEEFTSNRATIAKNVAVDLWGPMIARSVTIPGQTLTWASDTSATFATNGTVAVAIANGQITVTLGGADAAAITHVTYEYDNVYAPTAIPEIHANVKPMNIVAKYRTVKTNYAFAAGYGFEKQFGKSLGDKLAEAAMFELKREIDLDFINSVMAAAPTRVIWNRSAGLAVGNFEMHKLSFFDAVARASNLIFKRSKRVRGNVLVVGINAQSIVETLPGFDGEEVGTQLGGPKVIGKLKKAITVIAIPDLQDNDWLVLYKDKADNLDAGIIFAPYIPVMATDPVTLDDMVVRRAYITAYGKLVVNPYYFVRGEIVDRPAALPIYAINKDGSVEDLATDGLSLELITQV